MAAFRKNTDPKIQAWKNPYIGHTAELTLQNLKFKVLNFKIYFITESNIQRKEQIHNKFKLKRKFF